MSATATTQSPGWTITTKLAQANAASTVVKAGSTTTITVTATPPDNAPAGQTKIDVTATAGTKTITGQLGVQITGSYSLTLATPNDLVSAHGPAGSGTQLGSGMSRHRVFSTDSPSMSAISTSENHAHS